MCSVPHAHAVSSVHCAKHLPTESAKLAADARDERVYCTAGTPRAPSGQKRSDILKTISSPALCHADHLPQV